MTPTVLDLRAVGVVNSAASPGAIPSQRLAPTRQNRCNEVLVPQTPNSRWVTNADFERGTEGRGRGRPLGSQGVARPLLQMKQASTATGKLRHPNANLGVAVLYRIAMTRGHGVACRACWLVRWVGRKLAPTATRRSLVTSRFDLISRRLCRAARAQQRRQFLGRDCAVRLVEPSQ